MASYMVTVPYYQPMVDSAKTRNHPTLGSVAQSRYSGAKSWSAERPYADASLWNSTSRIPAQSAQLAELIRYSDVLIETVPLNLVRGYGGGALFLLAGILAAYIEAGRSGQGQVVDAAICDGTPSMMSVFHRLHE